MIIKFLVKSLHGNFPVKNSREHFRTLWTREFCRCYHILFFGTPQMLGGFNPIFGGFQSMGVAPVNIIHFKRSGFSRIGYPTSYWGIHPLAETPNSSTCSSSSWPRCAPNELSCALSLSAFARWYRSEKMGQTPWFHQEKSWYNGDFWDVQYMGIVGIN